MEGSAPNMPMPLANWHGFVHGTVAEKSSIAIEFEQWGGVVPVDSAFLAIKTSLDMSTCYFSNARLNIYLSFFSCVVLSRQAFEVIPSWREFTTLFMQNSFLPRMGWDDFPLFSSGFAGCAWCEYFHFPIKKMGRQSGLTVNRW